jgi:hypothetical protein
MQIAIDKNLQCGPPAEQLVPVRLRRILIVQVADMQFKRELRSS